MRYFTDALKKRCTTFLISDFIDSHDYSRQLQVACNKHDIIAIQVYDKRDTSLPDVGLMRVMDLETGGTRWINTSSKRTRQAFDKWWYERQQTLMETVSKCRVDIAAIDTSEDFVKALMGLFKKRVLRR